MTSFIDVPFDPDEQWGRTSCVECGREFVELLAPHYRRRPTLCCSVYCFNKRADRAASWALSQADIEIP